MGTVRRSAWHSAPARCVHTSPLATTPGRHGLVGPSPVSSRREIPPQDGTALAVALPTDGADVRRMVRAAKPFGHDVIAADVPPGQRDPAQWTRCTESDHAHLVADAA